MKKLKTIKLKSWEQKTKTNKKTGSTCHNTEVKNISGMQQGIDDGWINIYVQGIVNTINLIS